MKYSKEIMYDQIMSSYAKRRVLLITTGGTIAGNVAKNAATQDVHAGDDFKTIVDNAIGIIKKVWNIEVHTEVKDLFNLDSSNIQPKNWSMIIETIKESYDDYDAFIVIHGTNTMGYSAAAASYGLENIGKPVIFTGAQVPLGYLGSDAVTNLINALRISLWKYHPIKGVLGVFGSKIISGVRVKKGTDFDYDPFRSFNTGSIGQIGRVIRIDQDALEKHISYLSKIHPIATDKSTLQVKEKFDMESISSFTEFPGMLPDAFKVMVEQRGTKAFVFRAFGAGDASANLFEGFEYLKKNKIPIVVTTQAPNGIANFQVNETGQYLKEHDLAIPAFDMSIESMTTKMGWLLAQNLDYEEIKAKMSEDLHGEINHEEDLI